MSGNDMWKLAEQTAASQRAIEELTRPIPVPRWPVQRVISGGQTGADQAGLRAGKALGYQTGGMIPLGCKTEDGPRPDLLVDYNMVESAHPDYAIRTRWNVRAADATLVFTFGDLDGGSELTVLYAGSVGAVYLHVQVRPGKNPTCIPPINDVRRWLVACDVKTVNIAGNRESKAPGIGVAVETVLLEILRKP